MTALPQEAQSTYAQTLLGRTRNSGKCQTVESHES